MMILTFVFTRNKHLHLFLYVITRVGKHETLMREKEIRKMGQTVHKQRKSSERQIYNVNNRQKAETAMKQCIHTRYKIITQNYKV